MQALKILLISVCVPWIESISTTTEGMGRIANGVNFEPDKFPYVVGFEAELDGQYKGSITTCTGTLITPWYVLTAAHCTDELKASQMKIYLNALTGVSVRVEKVFQNELYKPFKNADLSVLKLNSTFSTVKEYARLYGDISDLGEKGLKCTVIGFGESSTQSKYKYGQMTEIVLKSGEKSCALSAAQKPKGHWDENLCAIPDVHHACRGDSGGPVICNGIQYGVTSNSYTYTDNPNNKPPVCGSNHTLNIYQYIKYHKTWIDNIITEPKNKTEKSKGSRPKVCMVLTVLLWYALTLK